MGALDLNLSLGGYRANLHPEWLCSPKEVGDPWGAEGLALLREGEDHSCTPPPLCLLQSREQRPEVRMRVEILSGSCVTLGKSLPLSGPQVEIIITPLHKANVRVN